MAPNNGLNNSKPKSGRTTVLTKGTVEDRGMGTHTNSREVISGQIQRFLKGEGRFTPKAEVRGFFTVWTFVTRLPGPTWVDHHPGYLMRGMAYFPISGSFIGIFVSVFFDLSYHTIGLPREIASVISEVASLWITGCFHEDGLADSSDGIGGGWTRDQILKIMTDTRLGTYGCAVLLLYMIAKIELLATLGGSHWDFQQCDGAGPAIIISHTLARLTAPLLIKTREYVDEQGPKYRFYSFFIEAKHLVTWHRTIFAVLSSFLVASLAYGPQTAFALIICVFITSFFSGRYAEYLLGGVMGDYLGATICVTEVCILIALVFLPDAEEKFLFFRHTFRIFFDLLKGDISFSDISESIYEDKRTTSLIRFVCVASFTTIWCSFVGHPPVFVRNTVKKKGETNEIQIALTSDESLEKEESPLEVTLSDDSLGFKQRYDAVRGYLDSLAKPVGSLGTLEDWAARIAALQKTSKPQVQNAACIIFTADHGVAKDISNGGENCSAYPQGVTTKVIEALEHKLAGASVLAKQNDIILRVIDVGLAAETPISSDASGVVSTSKFKLYGGTENFCKTSAMSEEEMENCILAGRQEVQNMTENPEINLILFGEVGIGNTTSSSAIIASISGEPVTSLCGSGATASHINEDTIISKKIKIIEKAIAYHQRNRMHNKPKIALQNVGGAEIAAIVGGILEASDRDKIILIDGFIVTTAAMIACQISPAVCKSLLFATKSTERGQDIAIKTIQNIAQQNSIPVPKKPVLDMDLRMGEGTGALIACPIVRSAAAVLTDLATLETVLNLKTESGVC